MYEVVDIPIDRILVESNIRQVEVDPELQALAASMAEHGQEVEVRVYRDRDFYILKSGHRRLAAAKLNGWTTIRAINEYAPEDEISLVLRQMLENENRQALSYMDKARIYSRLKSLGLSQRDIANKCGSTDADVSLALATLRAVPKLQKAIEDGTIAPSAVEPLLSQDQDVQEELADAAIAARTVRGVTALVKSHKLKKEAERMQSGTNDIPEDADPLELMAAQELEEAVQHLRNAQLARIQHPDLVRKTRPTVAELVKLAENTRNSFGE